MEGITHKTGSKGIVCNVWTDAAREASAEAREAKAEHGETYSYVHQYRSDAKASVEHAKSVGAEIVEGVRSRPAGFSVTVRHQGDPAVLLHPDASKLQSGYKLYNTRTGDAVKR